MTSKKTSTVNNYTPVPQIRVNSTSFLKVSPCRIHLHSDPKDIPINIQNSEFPATPRSGGREEVRERHHTAHHTAPRNEAPRSGGREEVKSARKSTRRLHRSGDKIGVWFSIIDNQLTASQQCWYTSTEINRITSKNPNPQSTTTFQKVTLFV